MADSKDTPGRTYIAIDLKSFYASVECMERNLDPMTTHLVVADPSRTEKTICLAVSPSLKSYGIPGRPRLFEVVQRMREVNVERLLHAPGRRFTGSSCRSTELEADPGLSADYITAPPRMAHYMKCSTDIYNVYLRYRTGGYSCLFHRRGFHGCDGLSENIRNPCQAAGHENDSGCAEVHRHHSHGRNRHEPVSL